MGEGLDEEEGLLPLGKLMELAAVLDTAERAAAFRAYSRQIAPGSPALWHSGPQGLVRLTHQAAMARTAPLLRARPAYAGDVAYVDGPRVTLRKRLALAAFVGDGHTTTALGRDGRAVEMSRRAAAQAARVGDLDRGRLRRPGPRWPGGLDRRWASRRVQDGFGGRLRWVEVGSALSDDTIRALAAAGSRSKSESAGRRAGFGELGAPAAKLRAKGRRTMQLIQQVGDLAWRAFQSVNTRLAEGKSVNPGWAPGALPKSHERTRPPLGYPRETDSLCPRCVIETRKRSWAASATFPTSSTATSARSGPPSTRRAASCG